MKLFTSLLSVNVFGPPVLNKPRTSTGIIRTSCFSALHPFNGLLTLLLLDTQRLASSTLITSVIHYPQLCPLSWVEVDKLNGDLYFCHAEIEFNICCIVLNIFTIESNHFHHYLPWNQNKFSETCLTAAPAVLTPSKNEQNSFMSLRTGQWEKKKIKYDPSSVKWIGSTMKSDFLVTKRPWS